MKTNITHQSTAKTSTGMAFPPQGHLPCLDGLRGIAILLVMLCHFGDDGKHSPLQFLRFGTAGVDLFFVLSGFLITGILFDSKSSQNYFRDFYIRRALRIFPLYYALLILFMVVLPCFHFTLDQIAHDNQMSLWFFGSNIVQAWQGAATTGVFRHFWSLAIEEQFYLVWPWVIYKCDRKTGIWICVACMLTSLVSRTIAAASFDPVAAREIINYFTFCRFEALAAGGLVALVARGTNGRSNVIRIAYASNLAAATILACLLWRGLQFFRLTDTGVILRSSLCAWTNGTLLIITIVAHPASSINRFMSSRFLRFFGKYSYALYATHVLLIPVLERLYTRNDLIDQFGSPLVGRLAFIAIMMLISVAVAITSWNLLEKPCLAWKDVLAPGENRTAETVSVSTIIDVNVNSPTRFDSAEISHRKRAG